MAKASKQEILNALKKEAEQILDKVFDNGYIDDHDGYHVIPEAVIVRLIDNKIHVCPAFTKTAYFVINPFYIDEKGEIHLSRCSIAGVIDMRGGKSLGDAVWEYLSQNPQETIYIVNRYDDRSMRIAKAVVNAW